MRRWFILVLFPIGLAGCAFGRGVTDEGLRQGAELAAEYVDRKLGDDFEGLSSDIHKLPDRLPPAPRPSDPPIDTLWYGLGALLAYGVGSVAKGYVRSKIAKKPA